MFTGLVEEIGTVRRREDLGAAARLEIDAGRLRTGLGPGDSLAVAGACLTVADLTGRGFVADVMPETLARTTLGRLTAGTRVNLERAVPAGGRLGGHVVQGHVDGVGEVRARRRGERWAEVTLALPAALARYVAAKGSVAVDGVSLTVTAAGAESFAVALVPTTLAATTLGGLVTGDAVNLEVDVVAKYVERILGTRAVR